MLFVRKLATPVTEELLEKTFSQFGKLERVKKLKDYAFVHFEERDSAVKVGLFGGTLRQTTAHSNDNSSPRVASLLVSFLQWLCVR